MKRFLELFRFKISFMVGLSAFAGACLFDSHIHAGHIYAVLAALFLAAGTSALNQYQERREDALMKRTKRRPIPSGTVDPRDALIISILLIGISFCFLLITNSNIALILALATIIIYNFIYTPLKKKTPFALLIGSVTGSIPPLLGYTALGGEITSARILIVACVMYIWQTPHFAMLAEKYAEDYIKAGFLTLSSIYGSAVTAIYIKIWIAAFICSLFFIPVAGVYTYQASSFIHVAVTVTSSALLVVFYHNISRVFHILNFCMVIFFLLLVVDRIII